jgi:proteasome lid subunit RPN8/RPN11
MQLPRLLKELFTMGRKKGGRNKRRHPQQHRQSTTEVEVLVYSDGTAVASVTAGPDKGTRLELTDPKSTKSLVDGLNGNGATVHVTHARKPDPPDDEVATSTALVTSTAAGTATAEVKPPPSVEFTDITWDPMAWLKLKYLLHKGDTEVAGFAITGDPKDPTYITDFMTVKQSSSGASFEFDDDALAEYMDQMTGELEYEPWQVFRIMVHTHPGSSPDPSGTDETVFEEKFGDCQYAVMVIQSRTGSWYARVKFNAQNGMYVDKEVPVYVDWEKLPEILDTQLKDVEPFKGWLAEYTANVQEERWTYNNDNRSSFSSGSGNGDGTYTGYGMWGGGTHNAQQRALPAAYQPKGKKKGRKADADDDDIFVNDSETFVEAMEEAVMAATEFLNPVEMQLWEKGKLSDDKVLELAVLRSHPQDPQDEEREARVLGEPVKRGQYRRWLSDQEIDAWREGKFKAKEVYTLIVGRMKEATVAEPEVAAGEYISKRCGVVPVAQGHSGMTEEDLECWACGGMTDADAFELLNPKQVKEYWNGREDKRDVGSPADRSAADDGDAVEVDDATGLPVSIGTGDDTADAGRVGDGDLDVID